MSPRRSPPRSPVWAAGMQVGAARPPPQEAPRALRVRGLSVLPQGARGALGARPRGDDLSVPEGRAALPPRGRRSAAARRSSRISSIPTPTRRCTSRTTSSPTCSTSTATAACRCGLRLGPLTDVSSMLASAWRPAFGAPLSARQAAREAARALQLRGVAVLPHRPRASLRAGDPVRAAQRRQGQPEPRRRSSSARAR